MKTEGFVCVGVPIGHLSYLDTYMMQQMIGELSMEFQKLISYPHQHNFMLMLRYCCNQKLLHLERAIGPHILLYSQQFDYLIDTTYSQYFDINFAANVDLAAIQSKEHAISHDNLIQLARVQLRALPIDGPMMAAWTFYLC